MRKVFLMMAVLAMVFATGCHKEPGNGGDNGGGNAATYTVTFDANGGVGEMQPQTFDEGVSQTLTASAFSYQYHTFVNWNTAADGTGITYANAQEVTIAENMTLYAQWELITYTVTFESNGGIGEMSPQIFNAGEVQAITSNSFTKDGYMFCGWYTVDKYAYSDGQMIVVMSDMVLFARWYSANGDGTTEGHNYVDLGLPSGRLWATCNVGASSPTDYGDYFAWGETEPKTYFSWDTYKYASGSLLTKYCNQSNFGSNGYTDSFTFLMPEDDAATANWGSDWRMPSASEMQELIDNCIVTWDTQNGVTGHLFTGLNGNSFFLPNDSYWSNNLCLNNPKHAHFLRFYRGEFGIYEDFRSHGFIVRPVCSVSQK